MASLSFWNLLLKSEALSRTKASKKKREDLEVLALILNHTRPRKDARVLAKALREKFLDFQGVLDAPLAELLKTKGMGKEDARLLKLVKASINLYLKENVIKRKKISNTNALLHYSRAILNESRDEQFITIFLNSQNEVVSFEVTHEGTVDHAVVYPRKILERALQNKASALILLHNHPHANPKPSKDDIMLTEIVRQAAGIFDIRVHDHIIISRSDYFSFRERGLL